jgi:hypothetical protein
MGNWSYSFAILDLIIRLEVRGQLQAPVALSPVLIGWEAEWAQAADWTLWRTEKYLVFTGNQTQTMKPVTSLYAG